MGRPVLNTSMGCTRTISTACSSGYHSLENYLSSKPRRPRYLEQPPYVTMVRTYGPTMFKRALCLLSTVQSANTLYPITVAANGPQNQEILLPRVLRDDQMSQSLINARHARSSGGNIVQLPRPETCQDSRGREHYCTEYVELRWRQRGLARSWSEIFYLVDDCGSQLDAILRSNVSLEMPPKPESLPLEQRPMTEGRLPAVQERSVRTLF
jgi:hypothetical protein